jgi:parallel beta-helix repeat protein
LYWREKGRMNKIASAVILTLLLSGILTPALNIQRVEAAMAAVYIMADGSVSPSTAPIQRNGSTYTLTDNITTDYDGIWIQRNNVILDGAGYTVSGNATLRFCEGVYMQGVINVTIRNMEIKGFSNGIDIYESLYISIFGNNITNNMQYGIWLLSSSNNNIKNNMIVNSWSGIYSSQSSSNSISGNNITGNSGYGIGSYDFSENSIFENNITNNGYSGISFYYSSNNSISGNLIRANDYDGIVIGSSSYNRIVGNNITENNVMGIRINYDKYTDISGNDVTNNLFGIGLFSSSYNSIAGNSITENYANGVWLSQGSSDNTICGNNIANNNCGISIDSSSNNFLYHNTLINNGQQVYTYNSVNIWDDDYPSGGNYWSDYTGADSNDDGIGDTPYIIDADNMDRYPHMKAWASTVYLYPSSIVTDAGMTFNINIIASSFQNLWTWQAGIQWDPTILECISYAWGDFQACLGTSKQSLLTINNTGGKTSKPALESALRGGFAPISVPELKLMTITFKAIKAGTSPLKLIGVSLKSQNSKDITAYSRWSDVNDDGLIDEKDVMSTYQCWESGHYNQTTDFDDDGIVDITDIAIVTSDFGKNNTDPQWGVTNTIYDIPVATVNAQVQVRISEACIFSVPYHSQETYYYCGPASLEMLFDFYGPDIPQIQIADVARTSPDGTYTFDMIRAAHFSNMSTSVGNESPLNFTGYTARKLGYAALECGGMTIDDLKSLILAGYPIIVCTSWHYRVVVGFDSSYIIFQDSYYGSMYTMTYRDFDTDWDYSGHWGLFVSPWDVKVSNPRNVLPGDIFDVTATVTYPWAPPFPKYQYPALSTNATISLPAGLALVPGETRTKTLGTGYLEAGEPINVTWTVQAQSLGGYAISVEAEGKVSGFVPPIPRYDFWYEYEDRIGGSGQSIMEVSSSLDTSPPTTIDDYDGLWHNHNFKINLTANDDVGSVMETYYKINNGPTKTLNLNGQPYITTSSANNTLEYWSADWAGNEEFPHKFLQGIKLDTTIPVIGVPLRTPSGIVQPTEEVTITVDVSDTLTGVKNVELCYTVTNGTTWENRTMHYNVSTNLYEATIPAQPNGTLVKFKIVAYDNVENMAVKNNFGKYYVYQVQAIYRLTITTTAGGTTIPDPGTHLYLSGNTATVYAMPNSSYIFYYWELDGVNVGSNMPYTIRMYENHTLRVIFLLIQPLSVAISPLSASIRVGEYLTLNATVTGGKPPYYYKYQWYLNAHLVERAESNSWIFTSTASGTYYVYLKVTDYWGNTTQSETARITVLAVPVGGYSFSIKGYTATNALTAYLAITVILAIGFIAIKRKGTKKAK